MKKIIGIVFMFILIGCEQPTNTNNKNNDVNGNEEINQEETNEKSGHVIIANVVSSPTDSESITLKNDSSTSFDISEWTLGDLNDPDAYNLPDQILVPDETVTYTHSQLPFGINDSNETIYLLDSSGELVDKWTY